MLEQIQEYLARPEAQYVIPIATGLIGVVTGTFLTRNGEKNRQRNHEIDLAELNIENNRINAEIAHSQYEIANTQNAVELQKLAYEENQKQHERDLESRKFDQERENQLKSTREEKFRYLAEKLGPAIREYTLALKSDGIDSEYFRKRTEFREVLATRLIDSLENNKDIDDEEYDVNDDDINRIDRLVNLKYPLDEDDDDDNNDDDSDNELSPLDELIQELREYI